MKATLYSSEGKKEGEIALPKEVFGVKVNPDLVYEVVRMQGLRRRQNTAHTKDRGEVSGGGRKPWRQKGTGRARHGSTRSPIWVGGGVAFGPRKERNYKKKINKKAKRKALFMVLSGKLNQDLLVFVSELSLKKPKTKDMREFLEKMPCSGKSTLVILPEMNKEVILATRNLENADTIQAKDVNPLTLLRYKYAVLPQDSVKVIEKTFL